LIALAAWLACGPAGAWGDQGHMAVGLAAYDDLARTNPAAVQSIVRAAAALPHREAMDAALKGSSGAVRDRLTFAYLSRWADDIRGTSLDHPDQHYRLRGVSPLGRLVPMHVGEAEQAYRASLATLHDRRATPQARAVALAWVFHIVGDMHQPLHAGTWLSWSFPKSDRAGTTAWVRVTANGAPRLLHDVWDHAADRPGPDLVGAEALTADLARAYPRGRLRELSAPADAFRTWEDESAGLARTAVYPGGHTPAAAGPFDAAPVSAAYLSNARTIAERRLAVAGHRLADVLAANVGG
jgi:hypothetical protein